ncbi:hypothetical protein [Rathayibacter oskolensis]|uniref:hypothetical protein n=1 Tax=Rathayibacter oskolensis TaxID=1891671 RepID=UPI0034662E2F
MSASDTVAVLLEPSTLPHGLPDFAAVDPDAYRPAFEEALRRHRAEIETIAGSPDEPTIENTLVALERSGRALRRVSAVFFTVSASDRTELTDALEAELAPLLSAHDDAITLDPRLVARLRALADRAPSLDLDAETAYLLERVLTRFERAGALLDDAEVAAERAQRAALDPDHPLREEPAGRDQRARGAARLRRRARRSRRVRDRRGRPRRR